MPKKGEDRGAEKVKIRNPKKGQIGMPKKRKDRDPKKRNIGKARDPETEETGKDKVMRAFLFKGFIFGTSFKKVLRAMNLKKWIPHEKESPYEDPLQRSFEFPGGTPNNKNRRPLKKP